MLKIIRVTSILILVLILSTTSLALTADKPFYNQLKFVYTRPREHIVTQWLILIYTEAFKRIGIEFIFEEVPPKRASLYSDEATVDGELGRIYTYADAHPDLIRVEEHHALVTFSAFTTHRDLRLAGWESLKKLDYYVEYRHGIKKSETKLPVVVIPERLSSVVKIETGIKKVLAGRTDIYIDVEDYVLKFLNSSEYKSMSKGKIIYIAGIMEQTTGHIFLHKKHRKLVTRLSSILKDMKEEGLFEIYREQVGLSKYDIKW